ncbi:hypothetical protein BO78DRAFT_244171 [Aspergillus sclerotiicarbonarius CBS 121057]|uniref:Uncharacterized protein n=1 Tax=Aspergillus sclerotiicarbonarius (strain CBS 121057 / IBT 28362) TaxID=1448318 RepID=A0A319ELT8_ASPSB|nr:hypothetical protein BO78DRAFT_244171 [Aspergillus sclerotiicarbonarius CBS 121057]
MIPMTACVVLVSSLSCSGDFPPSPRQLLLDCSTAPIVSLAFQLVFFQFGRSTFRLPLGLARPSHLQTQPSSPPTLTLVPSCLIFLDLYFSPRHRWGFLTTLPVTAPHPST